ncbi:MAG: succinate dehydrogenase, hydrophobic membrane anchor protein [Xanthomonadales bacterium]|nr:hypothetical protein [Xanthomonadales bacterium]MCC6593697.1 succinate dehydrogenase, hydrophobic membrane anchor protein [Xanthomonadales bacterium]MCE7932549.1 succinate dehydrogenase, hydrophobic membrane anchor protein [Xanthomonadales bacterium PRO6]
MSEFRTELKQVRGLGSAHEGTHHWWMQRITAVALVPLSIWFVFFLEAIRGVDYLAVRYAIGQPMTAALMLAYVCAVLHHAYLGVQVVIEDYVHERVAEVGLLIATRLLFVLAALTATVSILRLVFLAADPQ